MSDNSVLSRVMGQAEDAAKNFSPDNANLPATQQTRAVGAASSRPSLDSMMDSSGISVDGYLQLKFDGIKFGDVKGFFEEAKATIDISEIVPIVQVRATSNGNTTFIKSYDGELTSDGKNFAAATAHLHSLGNVITGPYQTSEVPLTITEDVVIFDKGKESGRIPAGTRVGTTPPLTGVKYLAAFLKKVREQGLMNETVNVNLKHLPKTNSKGNEWGVTDFELVGVVEEEG